MWSCVAYFRVSRLSETGNWPFCALMRGGAAPLHVVLVSSGLHLGSYAGEDSCDFRRVPAVRPKAVFINTYVSAGDISENPHIVDRSLRLPAITDGPGSSE